MMRRQAAVLSVLSVLATVAPMTSAVSGGTASVPPDLTRALPAHARVDVYVALHGYRHAYATEYHASGAYLAIVQRGRRVFQRHLPAAPTTPPPTLLSPAVTGLFALITPVGQGAQVYAFRLTHGRVGSGISGTTTGSLSADEGVTVKGGGFTLRKRDTAHQGSVAYRLITQYRQCSNLYCANGTTYRPDYSTSSYPKPNGVTKNQHGDTTLIRLEVADTEPEREVGLMNRKSLDPDSGMIFVWDNPVQDSFWMQNTYIPLTIAFLASDGKILETQDMAALTTNLHTPHESYQYAIEANLGFFAQHGIRVGDRVVLNLAR